MVLTDEDTKIINSIKDKLPQTEDSNREISINKDDINQLISIYDKLNNEVVTLTDDNTNLQQRVTTLTVDKNSLEIQVTTLTGDKTSLETQVNTLTGDKIAIENQVTTLTGDKTSLETQVNTLTGDKTSLETQVNTLTGDKIALENQVNTLTGDKTDLQQKVDNCEKINTDNAVIINELTAEKDRLTTLNQQYESSSNDPEEIVHLKNNINSISKEMTSIMEQITNDNKQRFLETYFQSNSRDDSNNPIITPRITNIDIGNNKTAAITDLIFANQGQLLPSNVEVNINNQGENTNNSVSAKITFTKQNIAYVENLTTSVTNTLENTKAYDHI